MPKVVRLTPQLAEIYASRTDKALSRGRSDLDVMNLVTGDKMGDLANSWKKQPFLPRLRKGDVDDQVRKTARILDASGQCNETIQVQTRPITLSIVSPDHAVSHICATRPNSPTGTTYECARMKRVEVLRIAPLLHSP